MHVKRNILEDTIWRKAHRSDGAMGLIVAKRRQRKREGSQSASESIDPQKIDAASNKRIIHMTMEQQHLTKILNKNICCGSQSVVFMRRWKQMHNSLQMVGGWDMGWLSWMLYSFCWWAKRSLDGSRGIHWKFARGRHYQFYRMSYINVIICDWWISCAEWLAMSQLCIEVLCLQNCKCFLKLFLWLVGTLLSFLYVVMCTI